MISGVALTLAGEALAFESTGIAIWLAGFVAVNALYLPLVEEPSLVRRFGSDYERYMAAGPALAAAPAGRGRPAEIEEAPRGAPSVAGS